MRTSSWWQAACKLGKALSLAVVLGAAPGSFLLHSCTSVSVSADVEATFPNPLGGPPIRIRISGGTGGPVVTTTGGDGLCFAVTWIGDNGRVIGGSIVTLPFHGAAPVGTKKLTAEQVPCSVMQLAGGTGSASGAGHFAHVDPQHVAERVYVFGCPTVPALEAGSSEDNAIYSLWVDVAGPGVDVLGIVLPMIASGLYAPVPPGVEVLSYTQFVPDTWGGHLIAADTEAFDEFRLDWNGQPGYADLASGTNVTLFEVNGWKGIRVFVPVTDFHGADVENAASTVRKTVSETESQAATASCTLFSR